MGDCVHPATPRLRFTASPVDVHARHPAFDLSSPEFDARSSLLLLLPDGADVHYPARRFPLFDNVAQFDGIVMRASRLGELVEQIADPACDQAAVWRDWKQQFDQTCDKWLSDRMERVTMRQQQEEHVRQLHAREDRKKQWLLDMQRKVKQDKTTDSQPMAAPPQHVSPRQALVTALRQNNQNIIAAVNDLSAADCSSRVGPHNVLFKAWTRQLTVCVRIHKKRALFDLWCVVRAYDKHCNLVRCPSCFLFSPSAAPSYQVQLLSNVEVETLTHADDMPASSRHNPGRRRLRRKLATEPPHHTDSIPGFPHHPQVLQSILEQPQSTTQDTPAPWLFVRGAVVVSVHVPKRVIL